MYRLPSPRPQKTRLAKEPPLIARYQDVGAGRAFRVGQVPVFLHDQLPPQRDHEEHAQPASDQRQQEIRRVFRPVETRGR